MVSSEDFDTSQINSSMNKNLESSSVKDFQVQNNDGVENKRWDDQMEMLLLRPLKT